jgi:hypothetical protein
MMLRLLDHIINQPLRASQVLRARRTCQAIILYGLRIDPFLRLRRLLFLIFRRRLRRVFEAPGLNYYFLVVRFLFKYHGGILWSLTILKTMRYHLMRWLRTLYWCGRNHLLGAWIGHYVFEIMLGGCLGLFRWGFSGWFSRRLFSWRLISGNDALSVLHGDLKTSLLIVRLGCCRPVNVPLRSEG